MPSLRLNHFDHQIHIHERDWHVYVLLTLQQMDDVMNSLYRKYRSKVPFKVIRSHLMNRIFKSVLIHSLCGVNSFQNKVFNINVTWYLRFQHPISGETVSETNGILGYLHFKA